MADVPPGTVDLSEESIRDELLSMIHGVDDGTLDCTHPDVALNLYPDKKFVTILHENCLFVAQSVGWDNPLFDVFFKGMFRTFVALRGSWHFYTIMGEVLDYIIRDVNDQFRSFIADGEEGSTSTQLLELEESVIRVMAEYLQSRSVEDPLVRSVGLTPFSKLFAAGSTQVFRLAELRSSVTEKLREMDRLFQMVSNYYRRRQFSEEAWSSKSRCSPWRKATLALAISSVGILLATWLIPWPTWAWAGGGLLGAMAGLAGYKWWSAELS